MPPGKFGLVYPAFGGGAEFSADWMSHILLRNVTATIMVCGAWDWLLYFSPLTSLKLFRVKSRRNINLGWYKHFNRL